MLLKQVNINGFGVWNDLSVEELSPQVTVLFGHNEAGKSTLLHFLRSMLYGRDQNEERKYLPPINGGQPGGSLHLRGTLGRFEVIRQWNNVGTEEKVWIESPDGSRQSKAQLDALLEGVDRATYNNIFAVGLRELQMLATLDDSEAARKIYELTSGLDRISLAEVVRLLDTSQEALISDNGADCIVNQLVADHQGLTKEIDQLQGNVQEWAALLNQQRTTDQQIEQFGAKVTSIEDEIQFAELAEQVRDSIQQRNSLEKSIDRYGELPDVSDETLDQLRQFRDKVSRRRARCTELRADYKQLYVDHNAIPMNRELARHTARVDALGEQRQWIVSLKQNLIQIDDEIVEEEHQLDTAWRQSGLKSTSGDRPDLSPSELKSLRGPLKNLESDIETLEDAKRHLTTYEEELIGVESKVEESLSGVGEKDLTKALETAGEHVNLLRQRIQLEEKIEKLEFQFRDAEHDSHDLLEKQMLTPPQIVGIGSLFGFGVISILVSMNEFVGDLIVIGTSFGGYAFVLGLMSIGGAYGIKRMLEHSISEQFDNCKRQLRLLDTQLAKAFKERDEIEHGLPVGSGPWVTRLKTADSHLSHLEDLIPLGNKLGEVRQAQDDNTKRIANAEQTVAQSKRKWRDALQALSLPTDTTAEAIKQLAKHLVQISKLRKSLKANKELRELRQQELDALMQRLRQLALDVGVTPGEEDPMELLATLEEELVRQAENSEHRIELRSKAKKIRNEYRKNAQEARKAMKQREAILEAVDVVSEEEYRDLLNKSQELAGLNQQFTNMVESVLGRLDEPADLDRIEEFVLENSIHQAEEKMAEMLNEHEQAERRAKECYERRGELKAQLENLEKNERLLEAQLELSEVETQLKEAISRWQTLAVTNYILDQIRKIYETERQPETLLLASSYLIKLTGGKYTRVWTPLSENTLYVENQDGVSKSLINLSEGTREQVFLAVRLALIKAFAKQGRVLPVILDDVLVNFDSVRSQATAELFIEFAAEGHQLLVFTCHEHILAMFQELGCDVRTLPNITGACRPGELQFDIDVPVLEVEEEEELVEEDIEEEYEEEEYEEEELSDEVDGELDEEEELEEECEEELVDEYEEEDEEELEEEYEEEEELVEEYEEEEGEEEEVEEIDYELEEEVLEEEVEDEDYELKNEELPEVEFSLPESVEIREPSEPLNLENTTVEIKSSIIQPTVVTLETELFESVTLPTEYATPKSEVVKPVIEPSPEVLITSGQEFGWDSPRRWYDEVDPRKDREKAA